ncbi:hypothetical protein K505DRAFT_313557 [Melanomma pulvis-pyrius CBS 109.77]|uniref:Uncharacterized protein n=1 Tax=Melanomma pulvis-pyrius CBS 109.77 TaxID=1314802 RepID=A0A6A6WYA1_9PLEO|nr:hypothetical protein K505DRAFT_313557 [Melanomma pulvis-pyrius CBS 109.77]
MSSSANPHARLIFKEAFDRLKETVDRINPHHTPVFQNTNLEDVFNASREIEKELARRNCLRNMRRLIPFLESLQHYSKSIEVLCNGTPYLPWIWAPIKVTLQIASEFPAAMEKLVATYSKIAEVIPRFDRLGEAFKKDLALHRVMAMAYADILDFHREAYSFFNQPGWRIFFNTLWGKADRKFKMILDSLAENCRLVETEAKTADIVEASSFRIKIEDQMRKEDNERVVARLQSALTWLDAKDEAQENELGRLHDRVFEHSCDWIQRHNEAKAWMSIRGSQPILWLVGKPGAGKSTLSATIIQFLLQDRRSAVLYYFCNHHSGESIDSGHVLRTLISELLRINSDMAAFIYEEHITNGHAPSIPRLKQLLQTLLSVVPSTRIIIDGVDELEDHCRSQVLNDVIGMASVQNSRAICKLLVSSRDFYSISKLMSKYPVLDLNKERHFLDTSITSFVHHRLHEMRSRLEKSQDDSSDILELRRAVHDLPEDLDQLYSRILDRITKETGQTKSEAIKTIFTWMVHGARYLKSFELLSAVSLHLGSSSYGYHAYEWEWVLNKCKPLIEVTKSGTVNFTHCTVHEYFTKGTGITMIDPLNASLEISHGCLSCLTQGLDILDPQWSLQRQILEVTGGRHALIRYSIDFWLKHLLASIDKIEDRTDLKNMLEALDELDDRHGTIKDYCSSRKAKPIVVAESLDEFVFSTKILKWPHLKDMLSEHLRFESSLKKQEFVSGKGTPSRLTISV